MHQILCIVIALACTSVATHTVNYSHIHNLQHTRHLTSEAVKSLNKITASSPKQPKREQRPKQSRPKREPQHSSTQVSSTGTLSKKGGAAINEALVSIFGEPQEADMLPVYLSNTNISVIRPRCTSFLACVFHNTPIELEHIVLENGAVHLIDPDPETKSLVNTMEGYLSPLKTLLVRTQQAAFKGLELKIMDSKKAMSIRCIETWNSTVYVQIPWLPTNSFHTLNDNVFSVVTQLIVQHIAHPKPLTARRSLLLFKGAEAKVGALFRSLETLFEGDVHPAKRLLQGGPYCVRRLSWTTPQKVFYRDSLESLRRAVYLVFRRVLDRVFSQPIHSNGGNDTKTTTRAASRPLKAIIVSRNTPGKKMRNSRNLHSSSELALQAALRKKGVAAEICNFDGIRGPEDLWRRFSGVDMCIGVHGAGLANCVMMPEGGVMVELQALFAYAFTGFMKTAFMANSNYIHVDVRAFCKEKEDIVLPQDLIDRVADLAIQVQAKGNTSTCTLERLKCLASIPSTEQKAGYIQDIEPGGRGLIRVFPSPNVSVEKNDVLGPLAEEEQKDCIERIYAKFPGIVKSKRPVNCAFKMPQLPKNSHSSLLNLQARIV
mmetsp:Transcript_4558/g.6973  ORF Transcript_4558/g.6973 Transcript_4558/m.6973 type:complete len:602 (+) Transcript_4558:85-1890(+)